MIKNYFKTAFRNLKRYKANSVINIAGLVVGFAAFLIIFLVVQYEESFDDFHANKDQIYRVVRIGRSAENREYRTGVPVPVTQGLRNDFPQLKKVAAVMGTGDAQVIVPAPDGTALKKFKEPNVTVAEPQFFEMFDFDFAAGDKNAALKDVNAVVLTKTVATKYFNDWHQAIGQSLKLYGEVMKVTAILNDPPPNTDFPLGLIVSYATLLKDSDPKDWGNINDANFCFIQLNKGTSVEQFQKLLDRFTDERIKPVNPGYFLGLQPLNELHYDARYGNFTGVTFSKDLILALSIIGLFLLIIACVNFINITTAHAVNRSKEVGVRKVLGGNRAQLVWQFLSETGILTLVALAGSVIVVMACISSINQLLGIHLTASSLFNNSFLLFLFASFIIVTILSGFYPAWILSGISSIRVLKGAGFSNNKGIVLRRGLVVFQFVVAQVLIIGTLVIASQMDYFQKSDMGFNKDAVINASFPTDSLSKTKMDFLRNEISHINGVKEVSLSIFTPAAGGDWATDLDYNGNSNASKPSMIVQMKPADTAFFGLYGMQLVAGRIYFPSDTMREFVVNETVVKNMGLHKPAEALGKMVTVAGRPGPIVGVVKDYHTFSLRDAIGPTVMTTIRNGYRVANIKIDMRNAKNIIASLQDTWNKYYPDYVFEYDFLDQSIAKYYVQEKQVSALYKIFSFIAIFISCLGLYGLISFMAAQRKKEIGIRKVLGAPVHDIVIMLSKEFTILITIAFLIAAPVAWYYMHQWLQQYTYRINMGWGFFIATIVFSLIIAWVTIGYTAIKAAVANPAKSLRTE